MKEGLDFITSNTQLTVSETYVLGSMYIEGWLSDKEFKRLPKLKIIGREFFISYQKVCACLKKAEKLKVIIRNHTGDVKLNINRVD